MKEETQMEKKVLTQDKHFNTKKIDKKKTKFIKLSLFLSLVIALSCSSCGMAEEIFDLGKIIIIATKIPVLLKDSPGSVSVITEEQIKSSEARDVGELLEKLAGVKIQSYGFNGLCSIRVRGSSASQVLIMIDGRPINLASSGDANLSEILLDNVERIEIARGPFSVLYGPGALGGVINIITKTPSKVVAPQIKLSHGSFNTNSYKLICESGSDKMGYFVAANVDNSDGYRENSRRDAFALNGKLTYSSFTFSGEYFQSKTGLPGSTSWPSLTATQEDRRSSFDITYKGKWKQSNFSIKSFINQNQIVSEDHAYGTKNTIENRTYGVNFQHDIPFDLAHNLVWGVDWKDDTVNARIIGGERKATSGALYLQGKTTLVPDLTSFLGARYDINSIYGSQISPRVSFIYHLREFTSLRASWGNAFRAPTMNDLYWHEDYGVWGMFGDPNLKPEVSSGYEVGIEHTFTPEFLGRVTFFSTQVDNLINWAPISPGSWTWKVQNIGRASMKGFEGEIKAKFLKKLSLSLNYTYLEAIDEKEFKGKSLPYRPKNKLFVSLDYNLGPDIQFHLENQFIGERYTNRENLDKLPSYNLLGAKITYRMNNKLKIFLKGDNLLNEKYEDTKGYPMPGTILKGGVEITL